MQIRTLAAALLLSTSAAAASTVEYPAPVAVPHGLVLTLNEQGRSSFNPADGVHQMLGGKTGPEWAAESVDWSSAPEARQAHSSANFARPTFPLPGIPGNSPACERADNRPPFCDVTTDPPATDHPAPVAFQRLCGSFWRGLGCFPYSSERKRHE